jgi:S1-C subfamily serine protease
VLIRTDDGLGSGVVLDDAGHIVTNAHVAGDASTFQVQLAGDPKPRAGQLIKDGQVTSTHRAAIGAQVTAVSVTVTRDGADHTVRLTLGELPGA